MLNKDQLTFMPLKGHHTGANIASIIASVLNEYGISGKVGFIFIPCIDADMLMAYRWDGLWLTTWPIMIWHSKL